MFWKQKKQKRIYMDYAASTPVRKEVLKAMQSYFSDDFGNASSIYQEGVKAKTALGNARENIAGILNARSEEIIFTSGGTEANNLAILGVISALEGNGKSLKEMHAVTSTIEHPSILEAFKTLEKKGMKVAYIGVDESGVINPKDVRDVIQSNTALVSIMYVNNEIGTIQPISEISKIIRHKKKENKSEIYFHTDASQAPLYLPVNVVKLGVDMLTLGGQKIYGPKGIGCLYLPAGRQVKISSIIKGGNQEGGLRAGTENIPLIIGLAKALELADVERRNEAERINKLQNYFIDELLKKIPQAEINGDRKARVPNNINVYIPNIDGEFFVVILDSKGIACATRSACKIGDEDEGSYVIKALGYDNNRSKSSLRFSLGKNTKKADIDYVVKTLNESIKKYSTH